jgi:hypothetical protein
MRGGGGGAGIQSFLCRVTLSVFNTPHPHTKREKAISKLHPVGKIYVQVNLDEN